MRIKRRGRRGRRVLTLTLASLVGALTLSPSGAMPSATVMRALTMLDGYMDVRGPSGEESGTFFFVAQQAGQAAGSRGVGSRGWYEAIIALHSDEDDRIIRAGGALPEGAFGLSGGGSGTLSLPIGDLGTAEIGFHSPSKYPLPVSCSAYSVGLTWASWSASIVQWKPSFVDAEGTVGGYRLLDHHPGIPRYFSDVMLSEAGIARVVDTLDLSMPTPVGFAGGVSCV